MPHTRVEKRSYAALLRARWRVAGLCIECGMADVTKYTRCIRCRRKCAVYARRWWRRHRTPERMAANRARVQRWRERQRAAA